MQNLKYAFRFIKRSFQLAVEHEELQKPWMTLTLGSLALMLAAAVPLALVIGMIGLIPIGMIFIGLISTFLLFCLRIFGEITALSTSQICDKLIRVDGEGEAPEPFRVSYFAAVLSNQRDFFKRNCTCPILAILRRTGSSIART